MRGEGGSESAQGNNDHERATCAIEVSKGNHNDMRGKKRRRGALCEWDIGRSIEAFRKSGDDRDYLDQLIELDGDYMEYMIALGGEEHDDSQVYSEHLNREGHENDSDWAHDGSHDEWDSEHSIEVQRDIENDGDYLDQAPLWEGNT